MLGQGGRVYPAVVVGRIVYPPRPQGNGMIQPGYNRLASRLEVVGSSHTPR